MALSPDLVRLLRCEVNRIVALAAIPTGAGETITAADGTTKTLPPTGQSIPLVDKTSGSIDDKLVDATFQAGAFVQTMWEMTTLQGMPKYVAFNLAYQALSNFLDIPTTVSLQVAAPAIIGIFMGAASLRKIADPCNAGISLPGLSPPDAALSLANAVVPAEPPPPPPQKRRRYNRKFGVLLIGAMGASAASMATIAVLEYRRKGQEPPTSFPEVF